jgi:hypothetical protein
LREKHQLMQFSVIVTGQSGREHEEAIFTEARL